MDVQAMGGEDIEKAAEKIMKELTGEGEGAGAGAGVEGTEAKTAEASA